MKVPIHNSVAIGGVGGSGTRLIANLVERFGFFIGNHLNVALDNLYFTLLFKRPLWFRTFPTDVEVSDAIALFYAAMTTGLSDQLSPQEIDYIRRIAAQLEFAIVPLGVESSTAQKLLDTTRPDLGECIGWGWKEPNTHIFLPQLAADIEDLKYVHVLRNGLDLAFSRNQLQLKNWNPYVCGQAFDTDASLPRQSLNYWIAANRRAIDIGKARLGGRFLLLNYDDLCRSPREGVQILADFLGVGLSRQEMDDLATLVAPISIGRWRQHEMVFSDAQLEAVRKLGFDTDFG